MSTSLDACAKCPRAMCARKKTCELKESFAASAAAERARMAAVFADDEVKLPAVRVAEFTRAMGNEVPSYPHSYTYDDVKFIIRMVMSELDELACTVTRDASSAEQLMSDAYASRDKCSEFNEREDTDAFVAEQADALVDTMYYIYDSAARKGINLDLVFDEVHKCNMAKCDSTGKVRRREDGKVMKPEGWKAPNISTVIESQLSDGNGL